MASYRFQSASSTTFVAQDEEPIATGIEAVPVFCYPRRSFSCQCRVHFGQCSTQVGGCDSRRQVGEAGFGKSPAEAAIFKSGRERRPFDLLDKRVDGPAVIQGELDVFDVIHCEQAISHREGLTYPALDTLELNLTTPHHTSRDVFFLRRHLDFGNVSRGQHSPLVRLSTKTDCQEIARKPT